MSEHMGGDVLLNTAEAMASALIEAAYARGVDINTFHDAQSLNDVSKLCGEGDYDANVDVTAGPIMREMLGVEHYRLAEHKFPSILAYRQGEDSVRKLALAMVRRQAIGKRSVLQDWVHRTTFMQQGVLLAAIRGPDGIEKNHPVKVLCRWLRRCILISCFEKITFPDAYAPGGGSFTGPCKRNEDVDTRGVKDVDHAFKLYLESVDLIPHHFHLHFMHAAEIIGYKHPDPEKRAWWHNTYRAIVNDAHLFPESETLMDERLGDSYSGWKAREEVTAK